MKFISLLLLLNNIKNNVMYRIKIIVIISVSLLSLATEAQNYVVPGTIINHSPASSGIYIGCPGIAITDKGIYLAKHSEFGPGSTEWESAVTHVYRSEDCGTTWTRISTINGLFWASIFTYNNAVYLLGTDKHHGNTVIMRSDDEGKTWTKPVDGNTGLLLKGQYHTAPVPVLFHNGRIWRAMEDASGAMSQGGGEWGGPHYGSFIMSAPLNADFLRQDNWTFSNVVKRKQKWLDGQTRAWLEGNVVPTLQSGVVCILRVNFTREQGPARGDIAAIIQVNKNGKKAKFNSKKGFIDLPGGDKKFTIRYDSVSNKYWTLTNYVPSQHKGLIHSDRTRNTLALACSDNLHDWDVRAVILYHPDIYKHAFQYVDWLFEGEDIIAVSRTAYDDEFGGAFNAHDANYLTFHRIKNFRSLKDTDPETSFLRSE